MNRIIITTTVLLMVVSCALAQVKVIMNEPEQVTGPRVFTAHEDISPPYEVEVVAERHGLISFINIYINGVHVNKNPQRTAQLLSNLRENVHDQYRLAAEELHENLKQQGANEESIVEALEHFYQGLDNVSEVTVKDNKVHVIFIDRTTHSHIVSKWWASHEEGAKAIQEELRFLLDRDYSLLFTSEGPIIKVHPRFREEFLAELQLARNGVGQEAHQWKHLRAETVKAIQQTKEGR